MLRFIEQVNLIKTNIKNTKNINELNSIRINFFGKKGFFTLKMKSLYKIPQKDRPSIGAIMNKCKEEILTEIKLQKNIIKNIIIDKHLNTQKIDISLPGRRMENGGLHPITYIINNIKTFFITLGFSVVNGLEIEDDYHNFIALNIPENHPTRIQNDTFWFDTIRLLRTQTSGIQIRTMKNQNPPIRIISPGRVYRNDYDQTHTPMFHQIEGLFIEKNINFSNLKNIMYDFLYNFFKKNIQIRFRPSYFPFTEPSAEVDIMKKNNKWLEILGCGMVHPNVLKNVGINSEIYSGFAFGIGVERLTMLYYGINDLRVFFENDLRFLKQFKLVG
ncbi:Phenylalanine--tRNA ligase alpha subunit [Serratia symbiotica]|nr:Phenylalanine--tRNA ligase alpha subunit [Serratia symbiotica]